jgi:hypothetical protein
MHQALALSDVRVSSPYESSLKGGQWTYPLPVLGLSHRGYRFSSLLHPGGLARKALCVRELFSTGNGSIGGRSHWARCCFQILFGWGSPKSVSAILGWVAADRPQSPVVHGGDANQVLFNVYLYAYKWYFGMWFLRQPVIRLDSVAIFVQPR